MPIMFRQRQTDPNVDRYPWLEQAAQIGLANQGLQQNSRRLDQNQQQIDLATQEAADASARWQQEFDMRKSAVDEQRAFEGDMAKVAGAKLEALGGPTPNLQGPQAPGEMGGQYDDDIETQGAISRAQQYASTLPNARAQEIFLDHVRGTLYERNLQKVQAKAVDGLASAIRANSESPFGAPYAPYYDKLGEMVKSIEDPEIDPKIRAKVLDQVMGELGRIQALELEDMQKETKRVEALAVIDGWMSALPMASKDKEPYIAARHMIAGHADPAPILSKLYSWSLGYEQPVVVEIGGKLTELSPKDYADHVAKREELQRRAAADAARANRPIGQEQRGISSSTLAKETDIELGLDKDGMAEFPVLKPDGTQKMSDPILPWSDSVPMTERRKPTSEERRAAMVRAGQRLQAGVNATGSAPYGQAQDISPRPLVDQVGPAPASSGGAPPPGLTLEEYKAWRAKNP